MPDDDGVLVLSHEGDGEMAAESSSSVDSGCLSVAMTAMANEFGAASARRTNRFDQLGADSASMWSVALTSPTVMAAMGIRTATESGSGRTRVEANRPTETGGAGG